MWRRFSLSAALTLLVLGASAAYGAEQSISGTVSSVDTERHTMVVKDGKGASHRLYWDETTRLDGGPLFEGATVRLRAAADASGKLLASSIQIKPTYRAPGEAHGYPNR